MDEIDKISEIPSEAVQTTEKIPETTIHVAQQTPQVANDSLRELAGSIHTALGELTTVQRELLEHLKSSKEVAQEAVTEPLEGATTQATEIAPEITEPQTRFIRRNGRRIKR